MTSNHSLVGSHVANTEDATFEFGRSLGAELRSGGVVLLHGELGAGKTVFARGLAAGLGVDAEEVHSPSFTLVNYYPGPTPFYHIDLYRLNNGSESAYAVDLDEILQNESAVVVIEWAERLGNFRLPKDRWIVRIEGDGDEPRRFAVTQES